MQINVVDSLPDLKLALKNAQSQVPFALARALTKTAQDVAQAQRAEIERVFDRPNPYTRNAVFVRTATKQRLEAQVWLKDGRRPKHYLLPQIEGGSRPIKRFEERLVRAGLMTSGERAVPAGGAQLDSYGNVARSQIIKILSQLKTAAVLGDTSNASDSARSRRSRAREAYFVSRGPGSWTGRGSWKNGLKDQHLPRGIWQRRSFGAWGTAVRPVFLFVERANYQPRYRFFEIGDRVANARFAGHFRESYALALRTALPRQQGSLF